MMKIIKAKKLKDVYLFEHEIEKNEIESQVCIDNLLINRITNSIFVQENEVLSNKNVLRGMGYQKKHSQGKLIQVLQGAIYDVIVDMRMNSMSYGQWEGFFLSREKCVQLWIPPGFAHGYYTLEDSTKIMYKSTEYYYPDEEDGFVWNDSYVNIGWPLQNGEIPIISEKDNSMGKFMDCYKF